jgi:hypothetical protein
MVNWPMNAAFNLSRDRMGHCRDAIEELEKFQLVTFGDRV